MGTGKSGGATALGMPRNIPSPPKCARLIDARANTHSFTAYSKPGPEDQIGKDYDASGHLNVETLRRRGVPADADFYLCGPPAFLKEMTDGLKSWGVSDSGIHAETFGSESSITPGIAAAELPAPHLPVKFTGTGPRVSFSRSGLAVPWDSRFGSLLELAEACDVPVRWSCRVGVCHTCESGLIDGKVEYATEPLDRPAAGNILLCCSAPSSDIELDL